MRLQLKNYRPNSKNNSSTSKCTSEEYAQMEEQFEILREEKIKSINQLKLAHEKELEELQSELSQTKRNLKSAQQKQVDEAIIFSKEKAIIQQDNAFK